MKGYIGIFCAALFLFALMLLVDWGIGYYKRIKKGELKFND